VSGRTPSATRQPHVQLTAAAALAEPYRGYTGGADHRLALLPATVAVSLVLKIVDSPLRPPEFVVGVHDTVSPVEGACAPSYLQVTLAPLGAYTVLGLPMDRLGGKSRTDEVALTDLLGPDGRRLAEQIRDAPTWDERFAYLDRFLLGRLDRGPLPAPEVGQAWRTIVATAGAVPIGAIADQVGWSHKHLITKFKQQIGLAPKTAARLVRLEQVTARLADRPGGGPRPDLSRLAAEAGYADQSHLTRDFHQFIGTTPAQLVKSFQDPEPAFARR
jgi:AraC-like DNA-binding protein